MDKTTKEMRAKAILDNLVDEIVNGKVTDYIHNRITLFSDGASLPCRKWSSLNQLLTYFAGTFDARGIKQWESVGRTIKKGAKAFYIYVPLFRKKTDKEEDNKVSIHPYGYKLFPVFRVEDTEGKELDYKKRMSQLDISSLPLIDIATSIGVTVKAGLFDNDAEGAFCPSSKVIFMNTTDKQVFLHELSHAIDNELPNKSNDYAFNEVVAELSSAFLGSLLKVPVDLDNTRAYIHGWAGKGHVAFKVAQAVTRVEEIYRFIESREMGTYYEKYKSQNQFIKESA